MKKYIIILFVISFCSVGPIAGQNIQLERWVVGNSVVDFNDPVGSTYASTNLPTIGSTSGVTSGIYDESGNTLFYTVNHIVYNNTGQVAGSLLSISSNHDITDVCIVPVPGECDKYFVVYVSTSSQYAAMYYSEVEIQNNQPIVTSWVLIQLGCPHPQRAGFAVGNVINQNGERWLYSVAGTNASSSNYCGAVNKHRITGTGIIYESTIMSGNNHPLEYTPAEVELSHDGTMLAWGSYLLQPALIYLVQLNSAGHYLSHSEINNSPGAYGITLEFSPDNQRLFTRQFLAGIRYIDIANNNSIVTVCGPGCPYYQSLYVGFLELANDGYIYCANDMIVFSIDPSTLAIGTKTLAIQPRAIFYSHGHYHLPNQIDGFDLQAYRDNEDCCLHGKTYNDINSSVVSMIWTATSNPFAQQAEIYLAHDLIIHQGVEIEIQDMTFRFAPDAKVIVQPGAKLTLDNTIFTSVEECGRRWAGVEVWGDRTKTQDSWDHAGFNDFQGHIIVRNQSEIKNALTAITAASRNPDGSIVWSTCGGIVQLENSGFTNNKTAIWIGGYSNFMPASSNQRLNRRPNRGYIHNCDFLTNDDFIGDMDFQSFVHLQNGGSKLQILGNRFTNLSSAAWIDRGTGIKAIQHPIVVTPLCTSTSPPCIKNEFHDLLRGIDASGFTPSNNIVISNCNFYSTYRGILLTNTTSSIITENLISLPQWDPSVGYTYGLYLSRGKDYHVEGNTFQGNLTTNSHGVIVHNSGADNNQVYRNQFNRLHFGIKPQLTNRGYINNIHTGLCLLCNTFSNNPNDYDIMVVAKSARLGVPPAHVGVAYHQRIATSDPNKPYLPADNQFSTNRTGGTGDFENSDGQYLHYSHADDVTTPAPIRYKPVWSAFIGLYYIPPDQVRCPAKLPAIRTLAQLYSAQNTAQVAVNSSKLLLDIWKDGGNIDLGDVVETTAPWEAFHQFNELMGMSPYLSEEVLISMINNPVFTALMVKLVCVANPQASRNDAVLDALSNRNPPMPEEYIDDILAERDSYSPLDELRANAGADYHLLRTIQKEIVAWYRNDSILGTNPAYYDSLVNFLSTMPGLTDKYELALTYMEFGDFGSMQNILDNIPFSFELSEIENQEHLHTVIAFGIAQTILEEELMPGQLTQNQINDLTDILEHGIVYTHEMALALLKWNNHRFAFEEFILDYTPQQQRKVKRSKKTSEPNLEVFPNPARDYFTLIYKVPETNKGYPVILITDITGRVMHRIDAQSYSGDVLVDATNFVSGVYSVSLITADNRQSMQRLVIVR
jgi:hypothetical protein